jgi:hypothetical protein
MDDSRIVFEMTKCNNEVPLPGARGTSHGANGRPSE